MPSNISLSDLSPRAQSVLTFPETRAKPGNCPNCGQSLLEDISSVTNSSGRLGDPDFGIPKAIKMPPAAWINRLQIVLQVKAKASVITAQSGLNAAVKIALPMQSLMIKALSLMG